MTPIMVPLNQYLAEAQQSEKEEFLARHPQPVLVSQSGSEILDPRNEYRSTLRLQVDHERGEVRVQSAPPGPASPVLEVKKSGSNSVAGRILVGRTETNDIVIAHLTVSKHHAYFRIDTENGRAYLVDAGSTNGTRLNGRQLAAGEARELRDGDQVFFGDVGFDFYTAQGFFDLLRSLSALR